MSANHEKKKTKGYWLKLGTLFSIGLFLLTVAPKIEDGQLSASQIFLYAVAYLAAGLAYGLVSRRVYLKAYERGQHK